MSYQLQWDSGTAGVTYVYKVGVSSYYTDTSYTITSGITGGSSYRFKIAAENIWGVGTESDEFTIVAQYVPEQMAAVTTTIDSATGGVKIAWTAPHDGSDTITSYTITISDSSGTYKEDTTNCDGSNA